MDCTWGFGNRGCKGGYPYRAMQWIIKHGGIATAQSYGRYLAQVSHFYHCILTKLFYYFLYQFMDKFRPFDSIIRDIVKHI